MDRLIRRFEQLDVRAFGYVHHRFCCKALDMVVPYLTHLGGASFNIGSMLLLIILYTGPLRMWAVKGLFALTVSHLVVRYFKARYPRKRPYMMISETRTFKNPLQDYSFPSGHTTAAFSVAVTFALFSSTFGLVLLPLAVVIGLTRMYLGLHFPSDCIAGALIGTMTALAVHMLVGYWL